jgi:hypothetical protein
VVPEKDQRKFWKVGRVFMMLWTEPAVKVSENLRFGSHFSTVWLGEKAYSEIRRFVVIREGYGNCICSYVAGSAHVILQINLSADLSIRTRVKLH